MVRPGAASPDGSAARAGQQGEQVVAHSASVARDRAPLARAAGTSLLDSVRRGPGELLARRPGQAS